jgi:hypothetical protein
MIKNQGRLCVVIVVLLFAIMAIFILPIACSDGPGGTNNETSVSLNQTNSSQPYYITIDPIGNVTSGDAFIIHGTTNVPATEVLNGAIFPEIFESGRRVDKPYVFLGGISIVSTHSGTNYWSVNVTDHWGDLPILWNPYNIYILDIIMV